MAILDACFEPKVRDFFLACFASVIRNCSNADPIPISGLEVTAHMRRLDAKGRRIDPFTAFERRTRRELRGMQQLFDAATAARVRVIRGDATQLRRYVSTPPQFDAIITSPPYNTAVDYFRRHTLETYWLGLVASTEHRNTLASRYIGRVSVRTDNSRLTCTFSSTYINDLLAHARSISPQRERTLKHYSVSMQLALNQMARALKDTGHAILVLGNSKWNGRRVRATRLVSELASAAFDVVDSRSYPTTNRYMSYERANGADVNREYVLVLRKRRHALIP